MNHNTRQILGFVAQGVIALLVAVMIWLAARLGVFSIR